MTYYSGSDDSLGRTRTTTDAKGKSTLYNYDVMGRILDVTDPLESITSYGYFIDGNLSNTIRHLSGTGKGTKQ